MGGGVVHPLIGRYEVGFLFGLRGAAFRFLGNFPARLSCGIRLSLVQNELLNSGGSPL